MKPKRGEYTMGTELCCKRDDLNGDVLMGERLIRMKASPKPSARRMGRWGRTKLKAMPSDPTGYRRTDRSVHFYCC